MTRVRIPVDKYLFKVINKDKRITFIFKVNNYESRMAIIIVPI